MNIAQQHIRNSHQVTDPATGKKVFHVNDPFALIQFIGYLKYELSKQGFSALFRGQRKDYQTLMPALFRKIKTETTCAKYKGELSKVATQYKQKCSILDKIDLDTIEALLQHYGFNTTWIDVVDNIWVALWFACHRWVNDDKDGWIGHFIQRGTKRSIGKVKGQYKNDPLFDDTDYAYIYVIGIDKNCQTIDLRSAVPSIFLRPHMQHGVLFRLKGVGANRPKDYYSSIKAIVRIHLDDALSWLGNGGLVERDCLFPSPYYDFGYKMLMEHNPVNHASTHIGRIQIHTNGKLL